MPNTSRCQLTMQAILRIKTMTRKIANPIPVLKLTSIFGIVTPHNCYIGWRYSSSLKLVRQMESA